MPGTGAPHLSRTVATSADEVAPAGEVGGRGRQVDGVDAGVPMCTIVEAVLPLTVADTVASPTCVPATKVTTSLPSLVSPV